MRNSKQHRARKRNWKNKIIVNTRKMKVMMLLMFLSFTMVTIVILVIVLPLSLTFPLEVKCTGNDSISLTP